MTARCIQVDLWGGELHQTLVESHLFQDWRDAFQTIEAAVDAGMLANVLHQDFAAPPERADEVLRELLSGGAA